MIVTPETAFAKALTSTLRACPHHYEAACDKLITDAAHMGRTPPYQFSMGDVHKTMDKMFLKQRGVAVWEGREPLKGYACMQHIYRNVWELSIRHSTLGEMHVTFKPSNPALVMPPLPAPVPEPVPELPEVLRNLIAAAAAAEQEAAEKAANAVSDAATAAAAASAESTG